MQVVHQRLDQHLRLVVKTMAGVNHIDAQYPHGLLLESVVVVEQPDVEYQVIWSRMGF